LKLILAFLKNQPQLDTNLKTLDLHSNAFTDESVVCLTEGCPKLKSLNIQSTDIVDPETIRLLINSFSNLSSLISSNLADAPDDIILLFLRQVIFRSILGDDQESQCLAIQCLLTYRDLFLGKLSL
jgi:hypothetical protein